MEASGTDKSSASASEGGVNPLCEHHKGIVIDDGDATLLKGEDGTLPIDFSTCQSTDLIRDEFPDLPQLAENAASGCQMCGAIRTGLLRYELLKEKFRGILRLSWEHTWDENFALYPGKGRFRLFVTVALGGTIRRSASYSLITVD